MAETGSSLLVTMACTGGGINLLDDSTEERDQFMANGKAETSSVALGSLWILSALESACIPITCVFEGSDLADERGVNSAAYNDRTDVRPDKLTLNWNSWVALAPVSMFWTFMYCQWQPSV